MFCVLTPGFLLPMLALKRSRVERSWKKVKGEVDDSYKTSLFVEFEALSRMVKVRAISRSRGIRD